MNILIINSYDCSPEISGGVNRTTYNLTRRFRDSLQYRCFLGFYNRISENFHLADFEGRICLSKDFDCGEFRSFLVDNKIDLVQVNFLQKSFLKTMEDIYRIANSLGIKVIFAFHMCPGFQTVTFGSWAMTKFCLTKSSLNRGISELKKYLLTLSRPLLSKISDRLLRGKYILPYNSCDQVVVLSGNYVKPYMRIAGVEDDAKFMNIPNALTFDEFASDEDIEHKKKQIIVVTRFDEDTKRISYSLKCWRKIENTPGLDDWRFVLVGQGRDLDYYRYLVQKWGLRRVVFTGLQEPLEYYRASSMFLMTSTAEGWPMVLAESIQMGVIPVAFDSFAAVHDLIKDGYNGFIVPNEDIDAMYEKLVVLMKDDQLRNTMSKNAVSFSHQFELTNIVERWRCLFERMLSSQK